MARPTPVPATQQPLMVIESEEARQFANAVNWLLTQFESAGIDEAHSNLAVLVASLTVASRPDVNLSSGTSGDALVLDATKKVVTGVRETPSGAQSKATAALDQANSHANALAASLQTALDLLSERVEDLEVGGGGTGGGGASSTDELADWPTLAEGDVVRWVAGALVASNALSVLANNLGNLDSVKRVLVQESPGVAFQLGDRPDVRDGSVEVRMYDQPSSTLVPWLADFPLDSYEQLDPAEAWSNP